MRLFICFFSFLIIVERPMAKQSEAENPRAKGSEERFALFGRPDTSQPLWKCLEILKDKARSALPLGDSTCFDLIRPGGGFRAGNETDIEALRRYFIVRWKDAKEFERIALSEAIQSLNKLDQSGNSLILRQEINASR